LSRSDTVRLQRSWYVLIAFGLCRRHVMTVVILALKFFSTFASSLAAAHSATLHHLSTLLLPSHVQNDDLAQRFRNEKYVVRMSRSGFGLLVGWLTEGVGGEATGAGEGFSGERGKRGRA